MVSYSTSSAPVKMPGCCACCLGGVEGSLLLTWRGGGPAQFPYVRSITASLLIPYCGKCVRHIQARQRGFSAAALTGLLPLSAVVAGGILATQGFDEIPFATFLKAAVLGVVLMLVTGVIVSALGAKTGPACASRGHAVALDRRGRDFKFTFHNPVFGRRFREMNGSTAL